MQGVQEHYKTHLQQTILCVINMYLGAQCTLRTPPDHLANTFETIMYTYHVHNKMSLYHDIMPFFCKELIKIAMAKVKNIRISFVLIKII